MDPIKAFGARFRKVRKQNGITIESLAEKSNVSRFCISNIEHGRSSPKVITLEKLAEGMGISAAAFFI